MKTLIFSIALILTVAFRTAGQSPSPTPFKVDELGQVKAANFDTWSDSNSVGSYRIAGQSVIKYDAFLTNFACGKVANGRVFFGGQQNFICGNVVFMPWGAANTVFGWDAGTAMTSGSGNTFFGHDAGLTIKTSHFNTMVGANAGVGQSGRQVSESIALGAYATVTENNQAVIGGTLSPVINLFIGSGVNNVSPRAITWQTTGGNGTNNRGASLTIAAGRSTGSATPSSISSSNTPQTLVKYWEITPTGSFKALTPDSKAEVNALVMRSPSGFCFEFKVTDTGLLLSTQIGCP